MREMAGVLARSVLVVCMGVLALSVVVLGIAPGVLARSAVGCTAPGVLVRGAVFLARSPAPGGFGVRSDFPASMVNPGVLRARASRFWVPTGLARDCIIWIWEGGESSRVTGVESGGLLLLLLRSSVLLLGG